MSSSAPTRAKTTELPSQLASLGLNNIADNLDDFLARATQKQLSPRQVLEQLARLEVDHKVQRSLERRFKRSKIGRFKPIADFDWNWPKKIDRGAIESALTLDFLREGRNFIVLGSNGLGKTMILKNIAHQAVLDGHSVLVRTASDMLDELDSDSPELRRQRLRKYFRPKLLCIDELGYLSYDENAADLLFHVVNPRYDARRSIVLTTNLAFKDWNTVFPNATCIATLLDRLTHHADVTVLEGKSYRVRESEQENERRVASFRLGLFSVAVFVCARCLGVGDCISVMISTNPLTEATFPIEAFSDAFSLASASARATTACSSIDIIQRRLLS